MRQWRAALLGSAGAVLANLMACGTGHAQVAVECINCHNEITDTLRWVQQAKDMVATLGWLKQQYEAVAHLPDNIRGMASQLATTPTLQNPFPQANTIGRIAGGLGVAEGAQQQLDQNRYYGPQGEDWTAQEMNRRATATANIQAVAIQHMQAIEERQQSLQEFYQGIEESPDVQQSAAVQARLQLEQNFVAGQQAQAQQLASLVQLQNRVDEQRIEERQRREAQEMYDTTGSGAQIAQE
jgi:hypothetical protein